MSALPRLYGIPAGDAGVVAIIRRGPTDWVHVGVWDLDRDTYTPGAWLRGTIYPQKCDVSPDGRWLVYSAMKQSADWAAGPVYEAVSRLPWLTALAAWASGTTYTRGLHFSAAGIDPGQPDVGDATPLLNRYGLGWSDAIQFAVERRRGWVEAEGTPPRQAGGPWDDRREVTMVKPRPVGSAELTVSGRYAAFRVGDPDDGPPQYAVTEAEETVSLGNVQWADWDRKGDLLVATDGRLIRRQRNWDRGGVVVADLRSMEPDPQPAPDWAGEW